MSSHKKFSDFSQEDQCFHGSKKKIESILNQDILIVAFRLSMSKQKQNAEYATIHFTVEDTPHVLFTGSKVLKNQLERYKENLPFYAQIKKVNNKYYTFA